MTRKEEYNNKCFSPDWIEVDLAAKSEERQTVKEERLESKRRKDLKKESRHLITTSFLF